MIEIESIKNYLNVAPHCFQHLVDQIDHHTAAINKDYPHYREWFHDVQLAGLNSPERDILLACDTTAAPAPYNLAGVVCLKNTPAERKLCTLHINNGYHHAGLSKQLVAAALAELGTESPLVTFRDDKLALFRHLINNYHWRLEQRLYNYYQPDGHSELCFNGKLVYPKKTTCTITPAAGNTTTAEPTLTR